MDTNSDNKCCLNRPQFGNRFLANADDVFKHNAWDDVEWSDEQEAAAKETVKNNSSVTMTLEDIKKYELEADKFWDSFYDIHQNRFFKDRHWLFTEFPELVPNSDGSDMTSQGTSLERKNSRIIFEIGCGVGNTILPILKYCQDSNLFVYGCDFSQKAVKILHDHDDFDTTRSKVFVMDASLPLWKVPFEENSVDIIILIFVLSAIHPEKLKFVTENCFKYLKPGGLVLLRDYGRYDMAQLRFKAGKCLQDNFYARGDGTLVYFFTQEEIKELFERVGFSQLQNIVDRRLQVNRGRMLKMYRVWIQAKFRKPE